MAPRRKIAASPETAEAAIKEIMETPVEKTLEEAAAFVNVSVFKLQDMLRDRLGTNEPTTWETVPVTHESLLIDLKKQMDAAATVQPYTSSLPAESASETEEPPLLEEEPKPSKKRGKKSTALTAQKTQAIEETKEESKETAKGINETLTLLQAQEAVVDSSQDATTYLATYAANLTNLKGEGLTYFAAQTLQKISNSSAFNPQEIMKQVGVPLTEETKAKLNETMGQVLGKSKAATQEILETTWGNGYNLQAELSRLENLRNSDG